MQVLLLALVLLGIISFCLDDRIHLKLILRLPNSSQLFPKLFDSTEAEHDFDPLLEQKVTELALAALGELAKDRRLNRSCIPNVCQQRYTFFNVKKRVQKFTMLNTFPGSGNTWLRSVIREGTRVYTGSVYRDKSIADEGYRGELKRAYRRYSITSVVKAHYPANRLSLSWSKKMTAVINIVRSPFDACVSEYNRRKASGHTAEAHTNVSKGYLHGAVGSWINFQRSFNSMDRAYPTEQRPLREIRDFLRIEYRRFPPAKQPIPVLTMFYEDFVTNPTSATAFLYAFLKLQYGELVPPVKDSVICAAANAKREEVFHRHHKSPVGTPMYDWKTNSTTKYGKTMCEKVVNLWNVHKWGECDGRLLQNKHALEKKTPFVPGVEKLPQCFDPQEPRKDTGSIEEPRSRT